MNVPTLPATPGKYRVVPAPDLNQMVENRMPLLLQYDFPFLVVEEMAVPSALVTEQTSVIGQAWRWEAQHPNVGGYIGDSLKGYQFNRLNSRPARGYHYQLVPDLSYVDQQTWSGLSFADRSEKMYLPCVPAVVVKLMSPKDKIEDLQDKVTKFVESGTCEGVIVDTRRDQVWIYNRGKRPYFVALDPIEFVSWPGFTLDCEALRDARIRRGLD